MRCTFKTVFYVNGSKERNGIVPIMGRVTINGTIAQFSCKQSVTKAIWDAKGNRATGKSKEAKTALVSKIGSLLGSGKLKEVEQHNRKLCELVTDREQYIDELHEKIQRMEDSHSQQLGEMQQIHQAEVVDLKSKHATEVSLLNDIVRKAKHWFPMLEARLQMEDLCRKIGFTVEQIGVLLTGKAVNISGSLYSEEYRRKFNVVNAEIKIFSDSTKPNQLFLYINRQPIVEWFKEQCNILKKTVNRRFKL